MPQTEIRLFKQSDGTIPLQEWLDELEGTNKKAHDKCLERILRLSEFGNELRRPATDHLRDGVYELRTRHKNVQYRILYFFCGQNVSILTHGFVKKGRKVPSKEIEIAIRHKKLVEKDSEKYTAEFE